MTTADSHEFWGNVFGLGAIVLIMGGFWLFAWHVDRQARKDAKARWDEIERRREESRVYWAWRSAQTQQENTPTPVAPPPAPAHNPTRRRMLPLRTNHG